MLDFMLLQGPQQFITENYVCSPPAAHILDERGDLWMLGILAGDARNQPRGHRMWNILRNGEETGEMASHIERRNNKVRILTRQGWKTWNGQSFA